MQLTFNALNLGLHVFVCNLCADRALGVALLAQLGLSAPGPVHFLLAKGHAFSDDHDTGQELCLVRGQWGEGIKKEHGIIRCIC